MNEVIVAKGRIFELVQLPQPDGRIFEVARRAPGVRLIVTDTKNKKVLLTKEFRREFEGFDYRLPGGKVFDTLEEFEAHRSSGDNLLDAAAAQVKAEVAEEAGITVTDVTLFRKSTLGTTVEWDLYIFTATHWEAKEDVQELEGGEVESADWYTYEQAEQMILKGEMQEERVALVLLQWLKQQ